MTPSLVTIKEASNYATESFNKDITTANISYLIQYGKVKKYGENGSTKVSLEDVYKYYKSFLGNRELDWKGRLGDDLNWYLSFDFLKEKDTTKHIHRLHPYKGKFIPQLVQYFLDSNTDNFKKQSYFKKGDIILDPFVGSGTTIVQANELGMHAIGVDISRFNCLISEVKILDYSLDSLTQDLNLIRLKLSEFESGTDLEDFEKELSLELYNFNNKHFPSPQYKYSINLHKIKEYKYAETYEKEFLKIYNQLIHKYKIDLKQNDKATFLDTWYSKQIRSEIDFAFSQLKTIKIINNKKIIAIILSRTIRSCRATTHSDLATLKEPQLTTYYCFKHKKICKPIFSIKNMFNRYSADTLERIKLFKTIKTDSNFALITADSRTVDIFEEVKKRNKDFYKILKTKKIKGIFTSPPYVGQIDYHEQHAYAYDLFGFARKDQLEIGPLYKGQGLEARKSYVDGISRVLINCKKYLADDCDIFMVANDKFNLFPEIAEKAGMKIVGRFKRPVLNRTERDRNPYSEIIFHLK